MRTKLLFNCKQTSSLADRFHEKQLGLLDKWRVKIHLNICDSCRNYYVQSELLKVELGRFIANLQDNPSQKLSDNKKKEIELAVLKDLGISN
jgi:predicted anti-sigma-YlaC factor YlaD